MIDRHHILFNRKAWESNDELKQLRQTPQLIVPMDRIEHNELHNSISHVPPLSYHIGRRALRNFNNYDLETDISKTLDNLLWSIESASRHPRADSIERGVAELAIFAVELQRPFFVPEMPTVLVDMHSHRIRRDITQPQVS